VWVGGNPNEPRPDDEGNKTYKTGRGSRFNALCDGLRSRLLYPDRMREAIDERIRALTAEKSPRGVLEHFLIGQMARGSVQSELAGDQLVVNLKLALERVDIRWPDERREQADRLGQRLHKAPCLVAGQLGRSKYGALYLIDKLTSIGESIAANGGLDDQQRDYLFDILGVDPVLRNGSSRVPAGDNAVGLAAVVEKEKARLTRRVEVDLDVQDQHEQAAARLDIFKYIDAETRRLESNQRRAERRFEWALETLRLIRAGVDPSTIIDPETKRPLDAGTAEASSAQPATPPPTSAAPPAPESPRTTIRLPELPPGLRPEAREVLIDFLEKFVADMVARTLTVTPDGELGPIPQA